MQGMCLCLVYHVCNTILTYCWLPSVFFRWFAHGLVKPIGNSTKWTQSAVKRKAFEHGAKSMVTESAIRVIEIARCLFSKQTKTAGPQWTTLPCFVLLKVPELKKLVVAKVWLEIALRVLKGSSFVEAYNPNSPRVSRLFEEQHDRKVAAAFNRHLKPLSSAHRSRQAAPLSAHKLLGKLSDAPLLVHLAKSLARKLMPKSSKALFQVDWEDWEKGQGNAYSCSIMFHPLWSSD